MQYLGDEVHAFPLVEACYAWTWNHFHMTPHSHDRAEIMYLLRGKCCVQTEDGDVYLDVGEFIFLDAGAVHALQVDDSCYMVNVEFSMKGHTRSLNLEMLADASPVLRAWLEKKQTYQTGKDTGGALYGILSAVVEDYFRPSQTDRVLSDLHLAQMMVLLAEKLQSSEASSRCLVHVKKCIRLLSEHMDEEIRIDELAAEVGISGAYLQRVFRQVQGMTIVEYLNKMRIERAKLLLAHTGDSVIDIAMASGFNSRQHFYRVFAAMEGVSPQQYRQRMCISHEQERSSFMD